MPQSKWKSWSLVWIFLSEVQCAVREGTAELQVPLLEAQADERFVRTQLRLSSYHPKIHRRIADHLNSEEDLPATRSWTIECETPSLFRCPECHSELIEEQARVIDQLQRLHQRVRIIAQTKKIFNGIYVEAPAEITIPQSIVGVKRVLPQQKYTLDLQDTVEAVGGTAVHQHCVTGRNVTIGVLDTGIDYTHEAFGGSGTLQAYRDAYYGVSTTTSSTSRRDGLFPTNQVIEGIDFLGDDPNEYVRDDDPIDGVGHGTLVASAIVAVAPHAKLIAVKACVTAVASECPDFALILGIEYLLDPNQDGSMDDKVDIINLSLGSVYSSAYHDVVSVVLEYATLLGVVTVVSCGNQGNLPYVAGAIGTTPNVISVGATNHQTDRDSGIRMKDYSSRGPGEANLLKPDISAPSNSLMAGMGSGWKYRRAEGTSFTAPLVAGAAALLLEQCPECSPLAIKSLLMNNAKRNVQYDENDDRMAPVTRMGSGELRVDKALEAKFWAYSLQEVQPSMSLGLVDAAQNMILKRSLVVYSLDTLSQILRISSEFRDEAKAATGVVNITFDKQETQTAVDCSDPVVFDVYFQIDAALAPPNTMTTSGARGFDPEWLDRHEWDGHIIIASDEQEIVLPFHMLLRQAAKPKVAPGTVVSSTYGPINKTVTIVNDGAGVAQIDAFDLIYSDIDDPEADYGFEEVSADIRTIGYRIVPVEDLGCGHMVEFSFQTWERSRHVGLLTLRADIYPDLELEPLTLWIPNVPAASESYIIDRNGTNHCTGVSSDHSSNTANTIMRACSNDLMLTEGLFAVRFRAYAFPNSITTSWLSNLVTLPFPLPRIRAPSYDIGPGETLRDLRVEGTIDRFSHGIQLVTNSFRSFERTGAATRKTETLNIVKFGVVLETEETPDVFLWPVLEDRTGPPCAWNSGVKSVSCTAENRTRSQVRTKSLSLKDIPAQAGSRPTETPNCPPVEVPRMQVPTKFPSISPSTNPTGPTAGPSKQATPLPSAIQIEIAIPTQESIIEPRVPSSVAVKVASVYGGFVLPTAFGYLWGYL